ncbi:rhodanese-like domain-containing protein [Aestuariibius insulae]|uniref:rhodanese-like domain-containing protein n=1 Tax=Aestuariibius insulae TaxID=2058287 RepID=UPI00345E351F
MKSTQDLLDEANATVPRLSTEEAIAIHAKDAGTFIDVRDSADIAKSGTIAGAQRIPRGFLEFAADPDLGFHNPALDRQADLYLVCGKGGQAALAGKTLMDLGFTSVTNVGGVGSWKEAGGPMEDA